MEEKREGVESGAPPILHRVFGLLRRPDNLLQSFTGTVYKKATDGSLRRVTPKPPSKKERARRRKKGV